MAIAEVPGFGLDEELCSDDLLVGVLIADVDGSDLMATGVGRTGSEGADGVAIAGAFE